MALEPGDEAPDFTLPDQHGNPVKLSDLRGQTVVLYFYPKADTPGCTKEACAFQEALPQLGRIGIDVIGVSPDKMKPIEKFAEQMQGAQRLAWADNAIKLAVDLTVAAINRVNIQGTTEQQAEQVRTVMARVFPEAVTLVREAREGLA